MIKVSNALFREKLSYLRNLMVRAAVHYPTIEVLLVPDIVQKKLHLMFTSNGLYYKTSMAVDISQSPGEPEDQAIWIQMGYWEKLSLPGAELQINLCAPQCKIKSGRTEYDVAATPTKNGEADVQRPNFECESSTYTLDKDKAWQLSTYMFRPGAAGQKLYNRLTLGREGESWFELTDSYRVCCVKFTAITQPEGITDVSEVMFNLGLLGLLGNIQENLELSFLGLKNRQWTAVSFRPKGQDEVIFPLQAMQQFTDIRGYIESHKSSGHSAQFRIAKADLLSICSAAASMVGAARTGDLSLYLTLKKDGSIHAAVESTVGKFSNSEAKLRTLDETAAKDAGAPYLDAPQDSITLQVSTSKLLEFSALIQSETALISVYGSVLLIEDRFATLIMQCAA